MWTGFDLLRRLDGFLEATDLIQHLLETLLVSILLGNRKLLDDFVTELFDLCFKDRNEIFHDGNPIRFMNLKLEAIWEK